MRLRPRHDSGTSDAEHGMLPMINVVFLLLIFFMLSGQLSAVDPFEVEPPETLSDGEVKAQDGLLHVDAEGALALDGEEIALNQLAGTLKLMAASNPELRLRIKADGAASALRVIDVMAEAREAGIEEIQLLAQPGPDG